MDSEEEAAAAARSDHRMAKEIHKSGLPKETPDFSQILSEAQNRWLRPIEICQILRNYKLFSIAPEPPNRPPSMQSPFSSWLEMPALQSSVAVIVHSAWCCRFVFSGALIVDIVCMHS